MKLYAKILGILSFIGCLGIVSLIIYAYIYGEPGPLWFILLLAILAYAMMHFIIIHRFGFNYKTEYTNTQKKVIFAFLVIFWVIFLAFLIPSVLRFNTTSNIKKEISNIKKEGSKPMDLGTDSTAYGYCANLVTKYEEGRILYRFYAYREEEERLPVFENMGKQKGIKKWKTIAESGKYKNLNDIEKVYVAKRWWAKNISESDKFQELSDIEKEFARNEFFEDVGEERSKDFIIKFLDKDGFFIDSIEITDYSFVINDSGNIIGINSNKSKDFQLDKYLQIADWKLIVK